MNALAVETAFKEASAAIYAPLPGYCGTNAEIVPNDAVVVTFICSQCRRVAGKYWTALLTIEIDAPALVEGTLVPYSQKWSDLLTWLENEELVKAAFAAGTVELNGYFVQESGQGERNDRWVCSIVLTAGVSKRII